MFNFWFRNLRRRMAFPILCHGYGSKCFWFSMKMHCNITLAQINLRTAFLPQKPIQGFLYIQSFSYRILKSTLKCSINIYKTMCIWVVHKKKPDYFPNNLWLATKTVKGWSSGCYTQNRQTTCPCLREPFFGFKYITSLVRLVSSTIS